MDHWTINVNVGVHGADYVIIRTIRSPEGAITRGGTSHGLLSAPLAGEELSEVLTSLAEELFAAAAAPPWTA
jgi:hypothetical protein